MGDMSEMRGLIAAGTFLGVALTLILLMPPQLMLGATPQDYNSNTGLANILSMNNTYNYDFAGTKHRSPNIDIGGWHIAISEDNPVYNHVEVTTNESRCFQIEVYDAWYSYFYNREDFQFYNTATNQELSVKLDVMVDLGFYIAQQAESHSVLTMSTLSEYGYQNNSAFKIVSSRCTMYVDFIYDHSVYNSPLTAYNNMALSLVFAIDFNERSTQLNAWQFITNLIFWQNIAGLDFTISALIRIPFIICLAYITFIAVLRVIGALFGGGA